MSRKEKIQKTNAMRELDSAGVSYTARTYEVEEGGRQEHLGERIAEVLGDDPDRSFKTLVTTTPSGDHVVCCIPVAEELDLKAAARAVGEKSLSMMHVRDLLEATGYVRGGCSPVGMKRRYRTVIDETCQLFDTISISGGRKGLTLEVGTEDLVAFCDAVLADVCKRGA